MSGFGLLKVNKNQYKAFACGQFGHGFADQRTGSTRWHGQGVIGISEERIDGIISAIQFHRAIKVGLFY
jgi:hypothetical protein